MPIFKNDIFFLIYIIYPNFKERGTPMTKKVAWRFFLVILSLMILIGVGLVIIMYYFGHEGTLIKLDIQYEEPKRVEFDSFAMVPGGETEYIINPYRYKPGVYDLSFDFIDNDTSTNVFDESVCVRIEFEGKVYCDMPLSELFNSDNIVLTLDMRETVLKDVKIVYYIPLEVGNEIQGAVADFDLFVMAAEKEN